MKHLKIIVPLAILAALAVIAYPLYAHCGKCAADGKKIATQLEQNKMTLAKVVAAAEQHSKGRAISVISELMGDDDKLMVEVYCIVGEKIMMCHVDGANAAVMGMKEVKDFPITPEEGGHQHGKAANAPAAEGSARVLTNETVDVGCGACIYNMPGVSGCPLAIKIDGKPYLVEGATWPNHDYCDRHCTAVVSGRLEGDTFIATSLTEKK